MKDKEEWIDLLESIGVGFTSLLSLLFCFIDHVYCVVSIVFGLILCFISLVLRGIFITHTFTEKKYGAKTSIKYSPKPKDPPKPPV